MKLYDGWHDPIDDLMWTHYYCEDYPCETCEKELEELK